MIAGCGGKPTPRKVRFTEVKKGPIEVTVAASGPIQPLRAVEVKSRASGELLELPFDAGEAVTRGTTIAVIDPREEREKFRMGEADLLSARARLTQSQVRHELLRDQVKIELARAQATLSKGRAELARASADHQRQMDLSAKGLASKQTLESVIFQKKTAEAALVQAEADLALVALRPQDVKIAREEVTLSEAGVLRAEVAFERAKERLEDTVIKASIDGIVLERKVEVGQIIASGISNVGGGSTLMVLADNSRLFVKAMVDESDIGSLKPEQSAKVVVDAFSEEKFRGQVSWISPAGKQEQDVTTFEVLVEVFDNEAGRLRSGMTATCQFLAARVENALWVPPSALRQEKGRSYLNVAVGKEGDAERLSVTPGLRGPDRIQVQGKGLREGLSILLGRPRKKSGGKKVGEGQRKADPLWFLKKKQKKRRDP
jgi:HlyD family secretion protein